MDLVEVITNYIRTGYINDDIKSIHVDENNEYLVFGKFLSDELKKVDKYEDVSNIGGYIHNLTKDFDKQHVDTLGRIIMVDTAFRCAFEEYKNLI